MHAYLRMFVILIYKTGAYVPIGIVIEVRNSYKSPNAPLSNSSAIASARLLTLSSPPPSRCNRNEEARMSLKTTRTLDDGRASGALLSRRFIT